jgi:anti-anti-sigma factor
MSNMRTPHDGEKPPFGTVELAHHAPGLAVVSLRGEHDLTTAPALTQALELAAAHSNVVVDFSTCSFIDSTVISALVKTACGVQAHGEQLALVIPPEQRQVARVAQMTHLAEIFPIYPTRGAALSSIQSEE